MVTRFPSVTGFNVQTQTQTQDSVVRYHKKDEGSFGVYFRDDLVIDTPVHPVRERGSHGVYHRDITDTPVVTGQGGHIAGSGVVAIINTNPPSTTLPPLEGEPYPIGRVSPDAPGTVDGYPGPGVVDGVPPATLPPLEGEPYPIGREIQNHEITAGEIQSHEIYDGFEMHPLPPEPPVHDEGSLGGYHRDDLFPLPPEPPVAPEGDLGGYHRDFFPLPPEEGNLGGYHRDFFPLPPEEGNLGGYHRDIDLTEVLEMHDAVQGVIDAFLQETSVAGIVNAAQNLAQDISAFALDMPAVLFNEEV